VASEETWVGPKQASNSRLNTIMKALWFKDHIKFDKNYLNTNLLVYLGLCIIGFYMHRICITFPNPNTVDDITR